MTLRDLVTELITRGVILQVNGDKLKYTPVEAVDQSLLETMKHLKPELVKHLQLQERRICELLHRYELGEFLPHVRIRLETIFTQNPPDAWQRLLTACDYLKITGNHLEEMAAKTMGEHFLN